MMVQSAPRGAFAGRPACLLGILALFLFLAGGLPATGFAAEQGRVITYGENVSPEQQTQLGTFFDVGPDDRVLTVTTAETIKAMEGIFPASAISSAYSSTALTCRDLGDGLDVTTRNISLVPPGLYAMAMVTAGIGDATLVVAAPDGLLNVQGMTALAGVFKSWEMAPCASGETSAARQRLALEELALTVQIGQAFGTPDGVQRATTLVLNVQKTIVTEGLTERKAIGGAISAQERAAGVAIQPELRDRLVDLMTRLAREEIDWGTYSAGWEIDAPDATTIRMTGDGIAVRNARATATAEANMTATAEANQTATAEANMTATAEAQASATAQAEAAMTATAEAQWALTATAQAEPTATPPPMPTATPIPQPTATPQPRAATVSGTVADAGQGRISIVQDGGPDRPVPYAVHSVATIVRGAERATLDSLTPGERAVLTIDEQTQHVVAVVVEARPAPAPVADAASSTLSDQWWLVPVGLTGILLVKRRRDPEPFVVTRKRS